MSLRSIHIAHAVLLAAYFGVAFAALPHLPETIPVHFDLVGRPTRWLDTTLGAWLTLPLLSVGTAAFIQGLMLLSRRAPDLWNISEKQAFLELPPGLRATVQQRLEADIGIVAILTTLLMASVSAGIYEVAIDRSDRLPAYAFLSVGVWCIAVLWIAIRASKRAGREVRRLSADLRGGGTGQR